MDTRRCLVPRGPYGQACDRCHRLKVRCFRGVDGKCARCDQLNEACTIMRKVKRRKDKACEKRKVKVGPNSSKQQQDAPQRSKKKVHDAGTTLLQEQNQATDISKEHKNTESLLQDALCRLRRAIALQHGPDLTPTAEAKSGSSMLDIGTPATFEGQSPPGASEAKTPFTSVKPGQDVPAIGTASQQTNNFEACVRASRLASVPHTMCVLELETYISVFKATMSISIYLPVLNPLAQRLSSLLRIAEYLTAFGWSSSGGDNSIQTECQELLRSLAIIAKELMPMAGNKEIKASLALLSCLGQPICSKEGTWFELCGLGLAKAVVRYKGQVRMIDVAKLDQQSIVEGIGRFFPATP